MKKTLYNDKKLIKELENSEPQNRVNDDKGESRLRVGKVIAVECSGGAIIESEKSDFETLKNESEKDVESVGVKGCVGENKGEPKNSGVTNKPLKSKILLMLSGVAMGFANGFFGGGGGMIAVPVLSKLMKYEEKKAHATALLVILPISIFSSISYAVKGSIDWKTAGFVAIGVVAGGIVGAIFLKKISNKVLTYLFAVIMIAVGIKMFL